MRLQLPDPLASAVAARLDQAREEGWPRRLWNGDASLWTDGDEGQWLGWLSAAEGKQVDFDQLDVLAAKARGFADAVLLGMGGSSLGPEVLSLIVGSAEGAQRLHVLDTTDPGQISAVEAAIDPANTLFIVSSKSGSTMEPELLREYFFDKSGRQGAHFVAVTDPGSNLEKRAATDDFAMTFAGDKTIGGRYSVLSAFGMVPAAVMGIDVRAFYAATASMVTACGPDREGSGNLGVELGVVLGESVLGGRDKVTLLPSPALVPLGAWLEQLLAESTGKNGTGIVPVDLEPLGAEDSYGRDRLFVRLLLEGDADDAGDAFGDALAAAGQPLVSIVLRDKREIGQAFFQWEVATAIAGAVIGIDPFDQPDVEDAKVATRKLVDAYEQSGALEPESPIAETADFAFFAAGDAMEAPSDPAHLLSLHFASLRAGDYAGFLAYIERDAQNEAQIAAMRAAVRDARQVATVAGFGPRFLHSTGQAYKGGPATGVFLTITRDPASDLAVPGRRASFGTVQIAQARGDMDVLAARGQRVLRVHLKRGGGGIEALVSAIVQALAS